MKRVMLICGILMVVSGVCQARPLTNRVFDAYFLGFETDPAMDYGGRDIVTVQSLISRSLSGVIHTSYVAPAYEFISSLGLSTVQHEVFGHGSRAREYNLDPSYSFGFDFSGGTGIGKDPETMEQNLVIAGGGTEGDSIMAHRILADLYTGDGTDGSKIPLMIIGKLDFSLYVFITPSPKDNPQDFTDEYSNGNDIAYYLTSRQAQRRHANPADVWNNDYTVAFDDPMLGKNYDDARAAAIWNLVDPSMFAAMYGYAVDHVIGGKSQVRPPVIPLGNGFGLTAGTRAFLGPEEVTRFLDIYLVTPGPLVTAYVRDLQSSVEQTYGYGGGFHRLRLGNRVSVSLTGDFWQVPESEVPLYSGSGWNGCGELETMFSDHVGISLKAGSKSEGYFPGTPMESGPYGGAGVLVAF